MNLDDEYSQKAAEHQRNRQDTLRRSYEHRKATELQPISDKEELSDHVARLAAAWGLKKKR